MFNNFRYANHIIAAAGSLLITAFVFATAIVPGSPGVEFVGVIA